MSKFFKNLADVAVKATIPMLKEERNVLEAEKIELEGKLQKEHERVAMVKPLVDQMKLSLEANTKTVAELQVVFRVRKITPAAGADEIAQIEDAPLRELNVLFNHLVQTGIMLTDSIAATDGSKAGEIDAKIQELTVQIAKYNERLKKLREGK